MDSDLELDFEGIVSSYSLAILYWVKRGHVKHKVFVCIKSTSIFSHVNLLSVSIQWVFRK